MQPQQETRKWGEGGLVETLLFPHHWSKAVRKLCLRSEVKAGGRGSVEGEERRKERFQIVPSSCVKTGCRFLHSDRHAGQNSFRELPYFQVFWSEGASRPFSIGCNQTVDRSSERSGAQVEAPQTTDRHLRRQASWKFQHGFSFFSFAKSLIGKKYEMSGSKGAARQEGCFFNDNQ